MGNVKSASSARNATPYLESIRCRRSRVTLQLATMTDDCPIITPKGRSVLLRGSPRLWDVAA